MTQAYFATSLGAKFPELKGRMAGEMAEIADFVKLLSGDDLDAIWNHFRDTYDKSSAPRRAVFVQAAVLLGIKRAGGRELKVEYCCYVCGARYEIGPNRQCPNCRNADKTWVRCIPVGKARNYKLKADEEAEREMVFQDRMGRKQA